MAKKTRGPWTVQEIANTFGLTPHHTRRLVHKHVQVTSGSGGTMQVPHAQVLELRDKYVATIEPDAKATMDRVKKLKRIR